MEDKYEIYKHNNLRFYFKNRQLHNENGRSQNIPERYCLNGKTYSKKDFANVTNHILCNCGGFCNQECFINNEYISYEEKIYKMYNIDLNAKMELIGLGYKLF